MKKLFFKKLGMYQMFDEHNYQIPVTVLQKIDIELLKVEDRGGLCLLKDNSKLKDPQRGIVAKYNSKKGLYTDEELSKLKKINLTDVELLKLRDGSLGDEELSKLKDGNFTEEEITKFKNTNFTNEEISKLQGRKTKSKGKVVFLHNLKDEKNLNLSIFEDLKFVDVTGISKGKGFQGCMKRHNFKGGPASHGCSISHRAGGSTGMRQEPARTFKGKKMAGHMGNKQVTKQNLKLLKIILDRNLIILKGAVPGPNRGLVIVQQAKKKTGV